MSGTHDALDLMYVDPVEGHTMQVNVCSPVKNRQLPPGLTQVRSQSPKTHPQPLFKVELFDFDI
jgi:hypothetical protein